MPISRGLLSKYKKYGNIFIETGTHTGKTVSNALAAGFSTVYSIELSEHLHAAAKKKFESNPRAHLVFGDSGEKLPEIIKTIDELCVFWLDAHYSAGDTAGKGQTAPLIRELKTIAEHPVKEHTILIDDVRIFPYRKERANVSNYTGIEPDDKLSWDTIMSCIAKINPNYKTAFEDGFAKDDIFVAYL
jgi:hypothetical protein